MELILKNLLLMAGNITGVIAGDFFTVYDNEFWLVEDLKIMLTEN